MTPTSKSTRSDWLILTGLIVLSIVPAIAGSARVAEVAGGAVATPENARFVATPLPVLLHIVCGVTYSLLGALQFAPVFRRRNMGWHRKSGRLLVPLGFVAALSGLWMTLFYPWAGFDGWWVYASRLVAGTAMTLFLALGVTSVLRRDIAAHRAWMMRAYALGVGAGSQVFTHIPFFLFPDIQGEAARSVCMAAGWAINALFVEWLIRKERRPRAVLATA